MGSVTVDDLVDPPRLLDLYADGCTIILQSLHRWWSPIAGFCRELEVLLDHAVQANAYLSPPGATGLAPHHDTHDVFVLQAHGTKHWAVREPAIEAPLGRHVSQRALAEQQPVRFEVDLHPGDCLYLPRGFVHSASAQDGSSLHLTIGVRTTTAYEVVRRLAAMAADEPELRQALPVGWARDPAIATRAVQRTLDHLAHLLDRVDPSQVAAEMADQRRRAVPASSAGRLLQLDALAGLDDEATVRAVPGGTRDVVTSGDRLYLDLGDRRLDLPAALRPAIEQMMDGHPHRIGALDDVLDESSRIVLVRRLVREGALELVPNDDG
jgi:lysine-specific demethylase/histidyl-hydroxylase NO66